MDTSTERKLVVVIGATGNQGGSVARRFLREGPKHLRVRGLTRNPASQPSRELAALGAEVVRADLFDADSLKTALKGANVIFSVTNYWEPFDPGNLGSSRREAERLGLGSVRRYAGHLEETAGRNIADAAAETAETLDGNGFIVSTLSHARDCSGGRITELYHFDAKADIFPRYVEERYPDLARKMSGVQTGCFMTSYRILPNSWLIKLENGTFEMRFCTDPAKPVPHLDPVADVGNFVYAVYQMSSGKDYTAAGTTCTWPEWVAEWSRATGIPAKYRQISRQEMIRACGDEDFGGEIADMFEYWSDPGNDGGKALLTAEALRKEGIECPMTSLREWMQNHDWSEVLSKAVQTTL